MGKTRNEIRIETLAWINRAGWAIDEARKSLLNLGQFVKRKNARMAREHKGRKRGR